MDKVSEVALKHDVMHHDPMNEIRSSAFENAFFHAISDLKDEGLKFGVRTASDNAVFYFWS